MNKLFLCIGASAAIALFAAGCYALFLDEQKIFVSCLIGSFAIALSTYLGNFMQRLKPSKPGPNRFKKRSLKEEIDALADANPQHPSLKRTYLWLIAAVIIAVLLRLFMPLFS